MSVMDQADLMNVNLDAHSRIHASIPIQGNNPFLVRQAAVNQSLRFDHGPNEVTSVTVYGTIDQYTPAPIARHITRFANVLGDLQVT